MRKIINSATTQYQPVLTEELVLDDRPISGSFNSITSDAVYKAISVDPGNVPAVESTDDGKVLTASYGEGGGSFAWATPSGGSDIPEYSADDADKVLGVVVDSSGDTPVASLDWVDQPANELPAQLGTAGQVLTVNSGATGVEWATPSGGGGSSSSAFDTTFNLVNNGATWNLSNSSSYYINLTGGAGVYAYSVNAEITDSSNPTEIDDIYNITVRVGNSMTSSETKAIGLHSDISGYPDDPATISFKTNGILNVVTNDQHVIGQNVSVQIKPAKTGSAAVSSFTGGSVTLRLAKLSTLSGGWQPES